MKRSNKKHELKMKNFKEVDLMESAMLPITKAIADMNQIKQGLLLYVNGLLAGGNIKCKKWKVSNGGKKLLIQE